MNCEVACAGNFAARFCRLRDGDVIRRMGQQTLARSRSIRIPSKPSQNVPHAWRGGKELNHLEAINSAFSLFNTRTPEARTASGISRIAKFLVIPSTKTLRGRPHSFSGDAARFAVHGGAVVKIASDPHDVRLQPIDDRCHPASKSRVLAWPRCRSLINAAVLRSRRPEGSAV